MATGFNAKGNLQFQRQLKTQKMSLPFVIVGSATSASVSISVDDPAILALQTQGNNQISAATPSGETATYSQSPNDSTGVFNALVVVTEPLNKVVSLRCHDNVSGNDIKPVLGSATGITLPASGNSAGTAIMVTLTSTAALNTSATTLNATLEVEYVVYEHQ